MGKTVIELFAEVGGFRVGLNNINSIDENGHAIEKGDFRLVWANQWEPSTKTQHAFDCYNLKFPADLVRRGETFYFDSNGKVKDKFPKENRNTNHVCHVRPHARVGLDHYELPVADKITGITSYTKQSFWFNKDFIKRMIQDIDY